MIDIEKLKQELIRDEAVRLKPYTDTVGKTTIGVGRNLTDIGISLSEADTLLINDISSAMFELDTELPWWRKLDDVRQRVIVNMAFNMGIRSLLGFRNTLAAIQRGDYAAAASGMRASKWADQVGNRAERLAVMMENGQ